MTKLECYLVRDLLPLYIDHACGAQTAEDVAAHLQSCESCRKLYQDMRADLGAALPAPELDSRQFFRRARKSILGIILALAAVLSCFAINAGGAWHGGRAGIENLTATVFYVGFWGLFSFLARKYEPLLRLSLWASRITLISAAVGFLARITDAAGILTGLIALFSAIPFYGLRHFLGWTEVYAAAAGLALLWRLSLRSALRKGAETPHGGQNG